MATSNKEQTSATGDDDPITYNDAFPPLPDAFGKYRSSYDR